jgi:hypothetical protein
MGHTLLEKRRGTVRHASCFVKGGFAAGAARRNAGIGTAPLEVDARGSGLILTAPRFTTESATPECLRADTMQDVRVINELVRRESAFVDDILTEVNKVIVGQSYMVERVILGLLTGGHVLLEGVPGLAKTLTVNTLATRCRPASSASSSRPTCCRRISSAR